LWQHARRGGEIPDRVVPRTDRPNLGHEFHLSGIAQHRFVLIVRSWSLGFMRIRMGWESLLIQNHGGIQIYGIIGGVEQIGQNMPVTIGQI
jgi:hypothetical protein